MYFDSLTSFKDFNFEGDFLIFYAFFIHKYVYNSQQIKNIPKLHQSIHFVLSLYIYKKTLGNIYVAYLHLAA